ncbi:MAG TPA: RRQRL motif-containing zinc-binding protein [Pseudonocardiaceae bacterium]|jgi:hypothetical protein|nr:RRQRL motif-containing zinc-binding protein [Pseudonocardiaceae bacterium]
MSKRQYPWVLAEVPWAEGTVFTRGTLGGLPLLSWGIAPKDTLATYRQLRSQGLRPGGHDPVAVLFFHSRPAMGIVFTNLYMITLAKPVRPLTAAKRAAIEKACAAHRICPTCERDAGCYIRPSVGMCALCAEAVDTYIDNHS